MADKSAPAKVLFTVTERFVNIHMQGASICQFGIRPDGTVVLAFPNSMILDTVALVDGSIVREPLIPLNAEMIFQEMDVDLAIPRYRRTQISAPEPPKRVRVNLEGKAIAPGEVEEIVEAIVDSFVAEPRQSKARTSAISKELSHRFDIPIMSIAGVRAALTRGVYGDLPNMIKAKQQHGA